MAKGTQRGTTHLEPLPPINPLLSTKESLPEALHGKDITKPRDLYTLLSLGHLPVSALQWNNNLTSGNPEEKKVKISLSTFTTSSKHWDDGFSQNSSYVHFDAQNPKTGLPILPAITRVSSASYDEDEPEFFYDNLVPSDNAPRKSIINEEDHKIKISTTYIFAPTERLHETVKYNKHVTLPKIKPKRNPPDSSPLSNAESVTSPHKPRVSQPSQPSTKPIQHQVSGLAQKKSDMYTTNSLFGMRPECIFINNQLGERNPLLRHSKESPTQSVPKASPGLNDLKDYEDYPHVYWELRDGTIAQPEDLEADMIDRDLYRLRQISTLKLNTIDRTFQVSQDPFRKWRGKPGEPIFSPRQQIKPWNRIRKDKTKSVEIPTYPQHNMQKPIHGMKISRLRLPKNNDDVDTPLSSGRTVESFRVKQDDSSPNGKELSIALADVINEATMDPAVDATPRDLVAASLDTYRKLEEEREEQANGEDLSIEKLHQLKGKREKKIIKAALAHVDIDSVETYKREHRAAPRRQISDPQNMRSLNNSLNRGSLGAINSTLVSPRIDSIRLSVGNEDSNKANKETNKEAGNRKQPIKAPVASILFQPQSERLLDGVHSARDAYPTDYYGELFQAKPSSAQSNARAGNPSPNLSDTAKDRLRVAGSPLKQVQLEVFAERKGFRSPIKIPTGRTSYHPRMPSYRLDLLNYPPSNPRQSCEKRSNSAGLTEGRQTHTQYTHSNQASRPRLESSEGRTDIDSHSVLPPRSSDNTGVNIRFGGQGKVIVTSSREGRRSR